MSLSFDGSGDDGVCGTAARYEVAASDSPIDSGADFVRARGLTARRARAATNLTAPGAGSAKHVAVRAVDDAGNRSYVTSAAVDAAEATDDPVPSEPGGPNDGSDAPTGTTGSAPADDGGSLPFTGLALALLLLLGLALALAGRRLRRWAG